MMGKLRTRILLGAPSAKRQAPSTTRTQTTQPGHHANVHGSLGSRATSWNGERLLGYLRAILAGLSFRRMLVIVPTFLCCNLAEKIELKLQINKSMTEPRHGENQPPPHADVVAASAAAASNTAIPSIDSDEDFDEVGEFLGGASASVPITTTEGEPEAHAQERHDKAGTGRLDDIDDYDNDDGLPPMPVFPGDGRRKEEPIHVPHHVVAERSAAGPTTSDDEAKRRSQLEEKGSVEQAIPAAAAPAPASSTTTTLEEEPTTPMHPTSCRLAAEEIETTPVRTNARKRPSETHRTPASATRTPNSNNNANTPGSATGSTNSGGGADFWSELSAAADGGVVGAVGGLVGATAETTERAVRSIFYTTRDRAEGNAGSTPSKAGGGGGSNAGGATGSAGRRRLTRPGSEVGLSQQAGAGIEYGGKGSGRRRQFPEYRARSSDNVRQRGASSSMAAAAAAAPASPTASPGQAGSASNAKLSPQQSPGVRRTGQSKRYISVSLSHEEEEGGEGGGKAEKAAVAEDHEFTIGDEEDGDIGDGNDIRGARSASIDSVGDVLQHATGPLSPDTVGSQTSAPPRQPPNHNAEDMHPPILGNLSYPDADEERRIVESFWRLYDDHIILSIFGILGILFRILASSFFRMFDDAFNENSALFTNLPMNCLSCFIMGLLCSGEDAMKILYSRTPGSRGGAGGIDDRTGAAKKHDGRARHGTSESIQHEGEFTFRESGADADEYVVHGGRPEGASVLSPLSVTSPNNEIRRRRRRPIDRIRAGGREMILEVVTGGTPAAEDADPDEEIREVQLMALERRIRASKSLLLFPAKKQDVDVMNHYFDGGGEGEDAWSYSNGDSLGQSASFESRTSVGASIEDPSPVPAQQRSSQRVTVSSQRPTASSIASALAESAHDNGTGPHTTSSSQGYVGNETDDHEDDGLGIDRVVNEVTENLTRLAQVDVAGGWDVGTTPEAMSDDLLLGLRVGFCGCLSTFSSWNSAMINLLWNGHITQAIVGYAIGLQLPIISYRAGQHAAVYWFVWRRRREVKRDERRGGYGLRLCGGEIDSDDDEDEGNNMNGDTFHDEPVDIEANFDGTPIDDSGSLDGIRSRPSLDSAIGSLPSRDPRRKKSQNGGRILLDDAAADRTTPSVRAIATAVFLLIVTLLINSLFFLDDTQTAISLLFSPFGVLARWRLLRLNKLRPGFPLGTFACNMLGCALSGSLGSLLAGNPGPEESMVVQSMIQGFAGSLSSLAAFVIELLNLIDPIIFKYDGLRYAVLTICWALVVGFITSQAKDWADKI